jgi:hypothetical protein
MICCQDFIGQRYHVDQPRTQIKRKGNSGDDLHRTAGPLLRQWEGGSQPANDSAAQPPSPAGSVRPASGAYKTRQDNRETNKRIIDKSARTGLSDTASWRGVGNMPQAQTSVRGSRPLTQCEILTFAIGHIQNDMTASCWFSYLLVFLHTVPMLSPISSAIVMFSGQLGDAIATPLVGLWSDNSSGIPSLKMVGFLDFRGQPNLSCWYTGPSKGMDFWWRRVGRRVLHVRFHSRPPRSHNDGSFANHDRRLLLCNGYNL